MSAMPSEKLLLIIMIGCIIGAMLFVIEFCWSYAKLEKKKDKIMERYYENHEKMLRLMFQTEEKEDKNQ